jgi:N6-L-threonylcarbamoyladenine synthase
MSLILGIETSCDECSASVVRHHPDPNGPARIEVKSLATFSQIALHRPYGGVVPEIASRNHLETVNEMIDRALKESGVAAADLDAIAVTNRPGLVGALLVGVSAAKAMAYALSKPLVPVHHLEGHAASVFLEETAQGPRRELPMPMLLAIVSGGHTNLYLAKTAPELWPPDFLKRALIGRSRDDAAGEAFDKVSKLLGLGYPGGPVIDRMAHKGSSRAIAFPRALMDGGFDFSFSGLKTAVVYYLRDNPDVRTSKKKMADVCASFQAAVVEVLVKKTLAAADKLGLKHIAVCGGVAANSALRAAFTAQHKTHKLHMASPLLCTDNGVMIAVAGYYKHLHQTKKKFDAEPLIVDSTLAVANWR